MLVIEIIAGALVVWVGCGLFVTYPLWLLLIRSDAKRNIGKAREMVSEPSWALFSIPICLIGGPALLLAILWRFAGNDPGADE